MAEIGITDHAVAQFIKRHAPTHTADEARELLAERCRSAKHVGKMACGDMMWRITDPECLLVVKRDSDRSTRPGQRRQTRSGGGLVVVTVLPPPETENDNDEGDEVA